jgi:hypothetical protein
LRGRFDRGNLIGKAEIASASPHNDNFLSAILGYSYWQTGERPKRDKKNPDEVFNLS